jgi:hypothetical protein
MRMSRFNRLRFAPFLVMMLVLLLVVAQQQAWAVHPVIRPIQTNGGNINQTYLYGEGVVHRGVDWSHPTGTAVYAIANGTVVAVREDTADNTYPANRQFGNYVMVRHTNNTHWDRTAGQLAWVYSIYAHLKYNSVVPVVGSTVAANSKIAEVNNTGNSSGSHLHLQVNLSTASNKTDPQEWTWSENSTRNPEAWLQAFNFSGTQTASVMGKVTDNAGNPVAGLQIWGMQKPLAAEGNSNNDFATALTYSYGWTMPDDIFLENFATTDIQPGTYCLQAKYASNGQLYRDLGCYNFVAGRTTYVGLHPVYLPDVRATNGWASQITVRNNSTTATAQVVTTFYAGVSGDVHSQRTDSVAPNANLTFAPPLAIDSSVTVVSSQDTSVVVSQERSSPYTHEAYAGVGNPTSDVRVALVHRNNSGWFSDLFIQNAGSATTNVTTEFIPAPGFGSNQTFTWNNIVPGARRQINTGSLSIGNTSGVFVGSVRITAGQPLAVASTQYKDSGGVSQMMESSNTEPAVTVAYAPLIQNSNAGWLTGLNLSRTGGGTFDVRYYRSDNGVECTNQLGLTNNPQTIYPAPPAGNPCPVTPLARLQVSSADMVAAVNQLQGTANAATYLAIAAPARTAIVAKVRRDSGWSDGFVIGNFSGATANVTVRLYNASGTLNSTPFNNVALGNNRNLTVLGQIPVGFNGSAVVTADQPVAVQANSMFASGSGDVIGSYPATHR